MQFIRYIYTLWAMWTALSATDAVAGLTQLGYATIITDKKGPACPIIVLIPAACGYVIFVEAFVVMQQDGRNVYTVWAGHTIFAVVAGYGVKLHHLRGRVLQEAEFIVS